MARTVSIPLSIRRPSSRNMAAGERLPVQVVRAAPVERELAQTDLAEQAVVHQATTALLAVAEPGDTRAPANRAELVQEPMVRGPAAAVRTPAARPPAEIPQVLFPSPAQTEVQARQGLPGARVVTQPHLHRVPAHMAPAVEVRVMSPAAQRRMVVPVAPELNGMRLMVREAVLAAQVSAPLPDLFPAEERAASTAAAVRGVRNTLHLAPKEAAEPAPKASSSSHTGTIENHALAHRNVHGRIGISGSRSRRTSVDLS